MNDSALQLFLQRCDALHRAFFVELAHAWEAAGQPAELQDGVWGLCVRSVSAGDEQARILLFALCQRRAGRPEAIEIDLDRWRRVAGEEETDRLLRALNALDVFPLHRRRDAGELLELPAPAHQDGVSLHALKECLLSYARRARDLFPR